MRFFVYFLLILISSLAVASNKVDEKILDNISHEYLTCSAYFTVTAKSLDVSKSLDLSKLNEASKKYSELADKSLKASHLYSSQLRSEEMTNKVLISRFEMGLKDMMTSIDYNFSNMSILMNKYSDSCIHAIKNPDSVYEKWEKKLNTK